MFADFSILPPAIDTGDTMARRRGHAHNKPILFIGRQPHGYFLEHRMIFSLSRVALAGAALLSAACSMVSVTTDYDKTASFAHYRRYILEPARAAIPLSPSTEAALRETLRASLAGHGIAETDDQPDLNVVPHVSTQQKLAVYPSTTWGYAGLPYRYGRYGMWAGAPMTYTDISQYTEGTLILDFVDAKTQKLVFRGVATGTVGDPESNAAQMKEAVRKIVADFPPGVAK